MSDVVTASTAPEPAAPAGVPAGHGRSVTVRPTDETGAPRWARVAFVAVTAPPFVPRRLWPRTVAARLLDSGLPAILNSVLNRIDINQLIIEHVSVARIINQIDLDTALEEIDVAELASRIVREIDLAGIVRASTGTLASDGVSAIRLQAVSADDKVDHVVARLVPGRRQKDGDEPG